ncbi:hypothetical protein SMICM304S_05957 [Streptomyces microflavus]
MRMAEVGAALCLVVELFGSPSHQWDDSLTLHGPGFRWELRPTPARVVARLTPVLQWVLGLAGHPLELWCLGVCTCHGVMPGTGNWFTALLNVLWPMTWGIGLNPDHLISCCRSKWDGVVNAVRRQEGCCGGERRASTAAWSVSPHPEKSPMTNGSSPGACEFYSRGPRGWNVVHVGGHPRPPRATRAPLSDGERPSPSPLCLGASTWQATSLSWHDGSPAAWNVSCLSVPATWLVTGCQATPSHRFPFG